MDSAGLAQVSFLALHTNRPPRLPKLRATKARGSQSLGPVNGSSVSPVGESADVTVASGSDVVVDPSAVVVDDSETEVVVVSLTVVDEVGGREVDVVVVHDSNTPEAIG